MTTLIREIADMRRRLAEIRRGGASVGLVPTMGALHEGHLSLIRRARADNDAVVVTIFVNPTQYDDPEDLARYPRTLDADLAAAQAAGADIVFHPNADAIYHDDYRVRVTEGDLATVLEGAHRPGHFDGVLTVVLKLFNIIPADRAYFGEKDWQQLELVRAMVDALFVPIEIVACPTVREHDGLAMSSRNTLLTPAERAVAPELYRTITSGGSPDEMARRLADAGFEVDYVDRLGDRIVAAVRIGKVRLIDNVKA